MSTGTRHFELLTCVISVADFNRTMASKCSVLASNDGLQGVLVAITNIRAKNDGGGRVPVLTIDGVARTLGLDPVDENLGIGGGFEGLGCPYLRLDGLESVSIDNLEGSTMLEICGYNIRIEDPYSPYIQWVFM
jgi:hypothetical protein